MSTMELTHPVAGSRAHDHTRTVGCPKRPYHDGALRPAHVAAGPLHARLHGRTDRGRAHAVRRRASTHACWATTRMSRGLSDAPT